MPSSLAYGLAVVSSDGQEETLQYQQAWIAEAATRNGWTVGRVFSGVASGKSGVRTLVRQMVDAIQALPKAQRPARVLMIRTDRLGREPLEVTSLLAEVRNLGVVIHTRADGDLSLAKASGSLLPMIQSIVAGIENESRIDKTNAVYERKKRRRAEHRSLVATEGRIVGISPRPPYGMVWDDAYEYYIPKPPESDAVRLAYELKTQGYGNHLVAKRLRAVAPPLLRKNGEQVEQHWSSDRIRALLVNPVYRGTIVDEGTWARAQIPVRIAQPQRKHVWDFNGALSCADCGKALTGMVNGRANGYWYVCRGIDKHPKMYCHRVPVVEEQFVALLQRLSASAALVAKYTAVPNASADRKLLEKRAMYLRTEIGKHEERRKRLFRALEDGVIGNADFTARRDELRGEADGHERELATVEQDLLTMRAHVETTARANEIIADAFRVWEVANTDDRRAISKAVGDLVGGLYVTSAGVLLAGNDRKTAQRVATA